jgi:tetratricopeptide (TPR) repeat protein
MLKWRLLMVVVVFSLAAQSAWIQSARAQNDFEIRAGEIRFDGTLVSYDAAAEKLVLSVVSFSLPNGKSSKLAAPKPKTVVIAAETKLSVAGAPQAQAAPLMVAGAPLMVIAREAGTGKDVTARLIMVAPPAGSTPDGSTPAAGESADPNEVAIRPGEARFDARVTGILSATNITVSVFSITNDKGETQELFPTLTKTIVLDANTPLRSRGDASRKLTINDFNIGSRVSFSGKDGGGAKIKAGEVAIWEENDAKSEHIGSVTVSAPVSMLLDRADQAMNAGAHEEAVRILLSSLRAAETADDRPGRGMTLGRLAISYGRLNQTQKAFEAFESALVVWRALGNTQSESTTLNNMGNLFRRTNQIEKAVVALERAVQLSRGGDPRGTTLTLQNLAGAYTEAEKYDKALETSLEALTFVRQVKKGVEAEAELLADIARLYAETKNSEKSAEYSRQAEALLDQIADKEMQAYIAYTIGAAYATSGKKPKALEFYKRAQSLYVELEQKESADNIAKEIAELDKPVKE